MAQRYNNPFVGIDLRAPIEHRGYYDRYCQTQSTGPTLIDQSPFPRMVDFWFAGMSIAARKQLKVVKISDSETFKFHEGSVFDGDSWRVQAIMLVAIAIEDDIEVVGNPRRMLGIANGLAAAGIPDIVEMLRVGDQDPIWNLSDALDDILRLECSRI